MKGWPISSHPIASYIKAPPTTKQVETKALKDQWVNIYPSHPYTIRNQLPSKFREGVSRLLWRSKSLITRQTNGFNDIIWRKSFDLGELSWFTTLSWGSTIDQNEAPAEGHGRVHPRDRRAPADDARLQRDRGWVTDASGGKKPLRIHILNHLDNQSHWQPQPRKQTIAVGFGSYHTWWNSLKLNHFS